TELTLADLDYDLPEELIAQSPAERRDDSRLLYYQRADRSITHRKFSELPKLLRAGDLLVMNDSRVAPARFTLMKPTGGLIDALFVDEISVGRWRVMMRNLGAIKDELRLSVKDFPELIVHSITRTNDGLFEATIETTESAATLLEKIGRMPLPPYIKREKLRDARDESDRDRYQTVFAQQHGSIAAPTAGLHFTPAIFSELDRIGIERAFVTLHVGLGTFKPIDVDDLSQHKMHIERYTLSESTVEQINRAKREKRRIITVGTTATRVLESQPPGELRATSGQTQLFIRPPCEFKHINALITNFHQPRSTLIALVMAFMGIEEQKRAYTEAVRERYRFLSYGDSMFIE
ncbi:MAG TPA: tRNA preQ1(34) S-adenosylmethionine ribosyltransferase-isomerase QueA, partial [Tepidisphaeraceae bacterium]|nr:tRNA preQ1(34) S-adenosylmethionine ribosyltransferase-isomerase QueA [Tepidisphaeraceae bacterium]